MTQKRLFIAINLPDDVKKRISDVVAVLDAQMDRKAAKDCGFRWLKPENWHLTLYFLGYQSDDAVEPILRSVKEVAKSFSETEIEFENIIWAPDEKRPRMIWISGAEKTSKDLSGIKNKLEDLLIENGVRFKPESRRYNAHLTLARFSGVGVKDLKIDLSKIEKNIIQKLNFKARSIDLMESELKRSGAEYFTLQKFSFKK